MYHSFKEFLSGTWKELIDWFYNNDGSVSDYIIKIIIAVIIFMAVSEIITRLARLLQSTLDASKVNRYVSRFLIWIIKHSILIYVIMIMVNQLLKVEASPLVTFTASACIVLLLVVEGVLTKLISQVIHFVADLFRDEDDPFYYDSTVIRIPALSSKTSTGRFIRMISGILYRVTGIAIAVIVVFFCYKGILYVTRSGGAEMSWVIFKSEYSMSQDLGTLFVENDSLIEDIPIYADGRISVKTGNELNLIYFNGQKVGVNTSSRDYKFYGVSINQPEVKAVKEMTYDYEETTQVVQDIGNGVSNSYIYYNRTRGDALILVVNKGSNRVASMTYYTDLKPIASKLPESD